LYTLPDCPQCEELKRFLNESGANYEVRRMDTAAALTDLRIAGVFVRVAPVLKNGKEYLTVSDLFTLDGKLNGDRVTKAVNEDGQMPA
jgi:glutaredoxin